MTGPARAGRRRFLRSGGALTLSFALAPAWPAAASDASGPPLPGSLADAPLLDAWIRVADDGAVTVFTGKAELGQGIRTALLQLAAEQLAVAPARITLVTADTARTPNEGYTAGSQSMQHSGTAIMHAAAQVRERLVDLAAARWSVPRDGLVADDGTVRAPDGRSLGYGELVAGDTLHVEAQPRSSLRPRRTAASGQRAPGLARIDIPAKVSGGAAYVQDLRMPGMVHARVLRPPSYGAGLVALDTAVVERMPGVLKVVRDGNFVGVIAQREYASVAAMRALARAARWSERPTLPPPDDLYRQLRTWEAKDKVDLGAEAPPAIDAPLEATYLRPYQMHGSIGSSCAVALHVDGAYTVWTHSQGVYPLRKALAEMLGVAPGQVRCIHVEGSGCYGHNGADDAAADAVLLARALPGRPVRVQWMREQEHTWEPYGPAMVTTAAAGLDATGRIAGWNYEVWSCSHSTRPGAAGNLAPAWTLAQPFTQPPPESPPLPAGGGDRNAIPPYRLPAPRVVHHFIQPMPLRVSALRALGAYANVFSIESFMDELAQKAGADPVEFRLRHLDDPRARDVIGTVVDRFGWTSRYRLPPGRGRGFAYARYKTLAAYFAIAVEVDVDRDSGAVRVVRAVAAIDSGDAVNPDGIRNQAEGGIVQSISWTLFEAVRFDRTRIVSRDWSGYPILRFADLPDRVDVHILDRPGMPFLGTGEAAQGPTAGAIANALANATGTRIRELPFDRSRVKQALRR